MEYNFIARVQETHACDDSMSAGATTVVEFDLMHGAQCVETRMSVRAPTSFCHRDVGARLMRKTAACLSMKEPNLTEQGWLRIRQRHRLARWMR